MRIFIWDLMSSVLSSISEVVSVLENILLVCPYYRFICCIVIEMNKATVSK